MTHPLISHISPSAPLAYFKGQLITAETYLTDVQALACHLPDACHVLNIASNRYAFLVGLGASIVKGIVSLLPSSLTPESLNELRQFDPGLLVIADQLPDSIRCDFIDPTSSMGQPPIEFQIPQISDDQLIARVFTSGSTGQPVPHEKHWGSLVSNIERMSRQLQLPEQATIIGTTPSQHMYGFESTILLCLLQEVVLFDEKPFFPADITYALESVAAPKVLVTAPFHLETLLDSGITLPNVNHVISATAPLSEVIARRAEQSLGCQLSEIFGATETGQIAMRKPTQTDEWTLVEGVTIIQSDNGCVATGGHLSHPIPLSDHFELLGKDRFRLLGRGTDMVNIAGKRTSLAYLNSLLRQLPEIKDGVFFIPSEHSGRLPRLALAYCADSPVDGIIKTYLRRHVDPVFIPRRIIQVDTLPRNPTGKILQSELDALVRLGA